MIALAGSWIVVHRLILVQTNPLSDPSKYPAFMVVVALAVASISGAVSEEPAFRGYFLSALERAGLGPAAVLAAALLMAAEHALTQGFVWPAIVFYLRFDGMQGALTFITGSIRPGVSLEQAASLGQVIAAIAVLGSLVFVGFQIRQNTRFQKIAAVDALSAAIAAINMPAAPSRRLSRLVLAARPLRRKSAA